MVLCSLHLRRRADSVTRWAVPFIRGGSSLARVGLPVAFPPAEETRSSDHRLQGKQMVLVRSNGTVSGGPLAGTANGEPRL